MEVSKQSRASAFGRCQTISLDAICPAIRTQWPDPTTSPHSGAHLEWNATTGQFEVGDSWANQWSGSNAIDRAENAAATAGDGLNRIGEGLGATAATIRTDLADDRAGRFSVTVSVTARLHS